MDHRQAPPSLALRAVVARFSQRRCADAHLHVPSFGLPARASRFIEFYLGEPVRVGVDGDEPRAVPDIVLVAPHTRPGKQMRMVGALDTFTVHFEATGLHRLFGLPLRGLADHAVPASDVPGRQIVALRDRLARADGFDARVACANEWLTDRLDKARPADALDVTASAWRPEGAAGHVAAAARRHGWSERHLHRSFVARTGLSPTLHARLLRFQRLQALHGHAPHTPLTELALDAGYFDRSHCIRDCKAFTGQPPGVFLTTWRELGLDRAMSDSSNRRGACPPRVAEPPRSNTCP